MTQQLVATRFTLPIYVRWRHVGHSSGPEPTDTLIFWCHHSWRMDCRTMVYRPKTAGPARMRAHTGSQVGWLSDVGSSGPLRCGPTQCHRVGGLAAMARRARSDAGRQCFAGWKGVDSLEPWAPLRCGPRQCHRVGDLEASGRRTRYQAGPQCFAGWDGLLDRDRHRGWLDGPGSWLAPRPGHHLCRGWLRPSGPGLLPGRGTACLQELARRPRHHVFAGMV